MLGGIFTHDIVRKISRRPGIEEDSIQVPEQNATLDQAHTPSVCFEISWDFESRELKPSNVGLVSWL